MEIEYSIVGKLRQNLCFYSNQKSRHEKAAQCGCAAFLLFNERCIKSTGFNSYNETQPLFAIEM